jgi:imidazolonepropionase-like amidohydrolase
MVLAGGTIYASPDDAPIRGGVVVIEGGNIAAVGPSGAVPLPPDAAVLDCAGCAITAGFWNCHVHFFERKWANVDAIPAAELSRQLQEMLTRYGFTSVFDLSSPWANTRRLRERIESGEAAGPAIRSTGEGLDPPGAVPPDEVLGIMGVMKTPMPEVADAEQAAAAALRLLDQGVDGIKLFASSPRGATLPESVMAAAATEAHRAGKPVFVHPNSAADVAAAVRAGADIVAHTTPRSGPWSEDLISLMRARRVALTPTLTLWKYYLRHDRVSTQEQVVATAIGQLRAWLAAGGEVLFGSDLGAVDYDPGEEYALMAEAGMTSRQILAALTTAPAQRFGEGARRGRIAPGFAADLAVFEGHPEADASEPRALASGTRNGTLGKVRYTVRAGEVMFSARELPR